MVNVLEFTFINMAVMVIFTGVLINNFEKYVPAFIIKGYRYGSFAYQGPSASFVQVIEIPKSYYRHFYVFASVFSTLCWVAMCATYFLGSNIHSFIQPILKAILQYDQPQVSSMAAFIAMSLFTVQCFRRLYETTRLQVFAKTSKMNLSHYVAGLLHYFGCGLAIIGEAPLFCGSLDRQHAPWIDTRTVIYSAPLSVIFLWAWFEQYQSNIIFANLRKDKKSGKLVTEDHGIPFGRLFEHVSSPHRMCEVIMYTVLLILVPTRLFLCIYFWVIGNQVQTAIQAHEWYKKTFKNYPKTRMAIFPRIL